MQRRLGLSLLGLVTVAAIACDDAHRVGIELGMGGNSGEVGGQGSVTKGGTNATDRTSPGTSGGAPKTPLTNGGSSSGTGGTNAAGGTPATGDATQVGGTTGATLADETCTWPTTRFEFTVDSPSDYCISSYGDYPPMEILTTGGETITLLDRIGCPDTSCSACNPVICMIRAPTQRQVVSPAIRSWDGSYSSQNTCNGNVQCVVNRCVPAGRYVARYCVAPRGSLSTCDESNETKFLPLTTCVDVPFDFPSSEVVRGKISSGVAGAGGSSGTGGANGGGTGGAANSASAGASTCLPGCTLERTDSVFCPSERSYAWVCSGSTNVHSQMTAAGCSDAMTGAVRYCCPASFQSQCQ